MKPAMIYLIPGITGNYEGKDFNALAEAFAPVPKTVGQKNFFVYVLTSPGLKDIKEQPETIGEAAEVYKGELLSIRSGLLRDENVSEDSPIIIAGYSSGATIAYEMVCQLQGKAACPVVFISLDGISPLLLQKEKMTPEQHAKYFVELGALEKLAGLGEVKIPGPNGAPAKTAKELEEWILEKADKSKRTTKEQIQFIFEMLEKAVEGNDEEKAANIALYQTCKITALMELEYEPLNALKQGYLIKAEAEKNKFPEDYGWGIPSHRIRTITATNHFDLMSVPGNATKCAEAITEIANKSVAEQALKDIQQGSNRKPNTKATPHGLKHYRFDNAKREIIRGHSVQARLEMLSSEEQPLLIHAHPAISGWFLPDIKLSWHLKTLWCELASPVSHVFYLNLDELTDEPYTYKDNPLRLIDLLVQSGNVSETKVYDEAARAELQSYLNQLQKQVLLLIHCNENLSQKNRIKTWLEGVLTTNYRIIVIGTQAGRLAEERNLQQQLLTLTVSNSHPHYAEMVKERPTASLDVETKVREVLIQQYSAWRMVKGLFAEEPVELKPEYVNLELLSDVKLKKASIKKEDAENKESDTKKEVRNERLSSYEDLFGDRRNLAIEDLFKSDRELFKEELDGANNNKPKTLLFQGRAGIGKTTLAKYISQAWAQGKQSVIFRNDNNDDDDNFINHQTGLYPEFEWVFTLFLRELGQRKFQHGEQLTLEEWIYRSYFAATFREDDFTGLWEERIKPALKQGRGLIIFEGYDEVPDVHDCEDVMASLIKNAGENEFANTPKFITSRPHAATTLKKDRNIEVIGFRDESIQHYVERYFKDDSNYGRELLTLLRNQICLWSNAHIPITLNIMCWILKDKTGSKSAAGEIVLPKAFETMTGLYEMMLIKLLARGYEDEKRKKPQLKGLTSFESSQSQQLLKHYAKALNCLYTIAYQGVEGSETALLSSDCVEHSLIECGVEPEEMDEQLEQLYGLGLLRPILVDAEGRPLSRGKLAHEFLHFTFQEFCAANYIANKFKSENESERRKMQEVVLKQKLNPRYQIVWWFVAGLSKTPESQQQLVNLLRGDRATLESLQLIPPGTNIRVNQDLFGHYELGLLVRCADEFVGAEDSPWVNEITQQTQEKIADLYWLFRKGFFPENYSSPFLSSLRISTRLIKQNGERDLFAKIEKDQIRSKCHSISLDFIGRLKLPTPYVLGFLPQCLGDENKHERTAAVLVVRALGMRAATPEIVAELFNLLGDEEKSIHENAAKAFVIIDASMVTPEFWDRLLKLLGRNSFAVRYNAIDVIKKLAMNIVSPQVRLTRVEEFLKLFGDMESYTLEIAMSAVGALLTDMVTPKVCEMLLELLEHKNENIRNGAINAVGRLGRSALTSEVRSKLAVKLLQLLNDSKVYIRSDAIEAFGCLGLRVTTPQIRSRLLIELLKLFAEEHEYVRRSTVTTFCKLMMSKMYEKETEIFSQLFKLLNDNNKKARATATEVIGRIAESIGKMEMTSVFLPRLFMILSDIEPNVRGAATEAIGQIAVCVGMDMIPVILPRLFMMLSDQVPRIRIIATKAVGQIGMSVGMMEMRSVILPRLLMMLRDREPGVRSSAANSVERIGASAATPEILAGLLSLDTHEDDLAGISALGVIGITAATPEMKSKIVQRILWAPLLGDRSHEDGGSPWDFWDAAKSALTNLGISPATPEVSSEIFSGLLKLLEDRYEGVRYDAIGVIESLATSVVNPEMRSKILENLLNRFYDTERVCAAAVNAVAKLGTDTATPEMISKILDELLKLFEYGAAEVCRRAVDTVIKLKIKGALPKILAKLLELFVNNRYSSDDVFRSATQAIRSFGLSAVTPTVLSQLFESSITAKDTSNPIDIMSRTHLSKLLSDLVKNYLGQLFTMWNKEFKDNLSSEGSVKFLSAIFYGASVSGSCHLQIIWDDSTKRYYLEGYADKEKVNIEITESQARYLQEFKWELVFDALETKASQRQSVSVSSASMTLITNSLSIFSTKISELINLNYTFQLKRIEKNIFIKCVKGETSRRETNTNLWVLKDLFNKVLQDNKLLNSVWVGDFGDIRRDMHVNMLYITCDTITVANEVAELIKLSSGDHITQSLKHGFFTGFGNETTTSHVAKLDRVHVSQSRIHSFFSDSGKGAESTSESEHTIQCAIQ